MQEGELRTRTVETPYEETTLLSRLRHTALLAPAWTPAVANDFYGGKTIRFIVGFSAGGGYDSYARTVARHIAKHIPGNPGTVVENMEGAASILAANHIYNKVEPDGPTLGISAAEIEKQVELIYSMPPKVKANLQFLMRKPTTS